MIIEKNVYKLLVFFLLTIYIISCTNKKSNKPEMAIDNIRDNDSDYFNIDTLLLKKYITDSGNEIELRGNKSGYIYIIKLNNIIYYISENWYEAAHQQIIWDNKDFVFISYGCGTECWGGKLLSAKDRKAIYKYQFYIYTDSMKNHIVYPDSYKLNSLCFENLKTSKIKTYEFDFCEKVTNSIHAIDTIFNITGNSILVRYKSKDCDKIKEKVVEIN